MSTPTVTLAGVAYVTGRQIAARWPDVSADRLRDWTRDGWLHPLTVAQLAAITGLPCPDVGADQPARWPGPHGPENLYAEHEVVDVEARMRLQGRGRPRAPQRAARPRLRVA